MKQNTNEQPSKLRIVSLGGVDEIGKNMYVIEYEDDIVVVDCGSIFPKEDMLGVDLVIPDVSYLVTKKNNVRGFLLTHGHEDHIGAIPYVLHQVDAPLYGTRLTLALVDGKLKEHRMSNIRMQVVEPREVIQLGQFTVQFIHVSHSIAGACAIAITCPEGTVICSGDFKVDYTPIDGEVIDLQTLAAYGEQGVLALLCESTNVERSGFTMSELKVGETFENMFREAKGRVIVAMFASNIHRMTDLPKVGKDEKGLRHTCRGSANEKKPSGSFAEHRQTSETASVRLPSIGSFRFGHLT